MSCVTKYEIWHDLWGSLKVCYLQSDLYMLSVYFVTG